MSPVTLATPDTFTLTVRRIGKNPGKAHLRREASALAMINVTMVLWRGQPGRSGRP
jgi:hypothetical protein